MMFLVFPLNPRRCQTCIMNGCEIVRKFESSRRKGKGVSFVKGHLSTKCQMKSKNFTIPEVEIDVWQTLETMIWIIARFSRLYTWPSSCVKHSS